MQGLKALVFGMAALLLAGIGVLAWGLARHWQGAEMPAAAGDADAQSFAAAQVPAPPGMRFEQMTATADRVLIRFSGAEGERIVVLDARSGRVTGTIQIPPADK